MMKDYVNIICRRVQEIIHSSWKGGGVYWCRGKHTAGDLYPLWYTVYHIDVVSVGGDFNYTFIGLKGSNSATVLKYMCIQSADATVSISSNFKPELIRMNLYLMKLLAFLLAETHWHLILKLTGSYIFYFFYNTLWTFFRRVKGLCLIHDIQSDLVPYESTPEPLLSNLGVKMPRNLN